MLRLLNPTKVTPFRGYVTSFVRSYSNSKANTDTLQTAGVFPDVIDQFKPSIEIRAIYPDGSAVNAGNELKPSLTQGRPDITLLSNEPYSNKSFTLAITDPDAPTRGDPTWSEFAHFLVSGIKPTVVEDSFKVDFNQAKEHIPYMGPGPPANTGYHRYVFLLFEENGEVNGLPSDNRANWGTGIPGSGVRNWLKNQKLVPVGINFFVAKNEQS